MKAGHQKSQSPKNGKPRHKAEEEHRGYRMVVAIKHSERQELADLAAEDDRTMSSLVRLLIMRALPAFKAEVQANH